MSYNYIMMPKIMKETHAGWNSFEIQDEMLQRREIECIGSIDQESVYALILQLRYLQSLDPKEKITIYINSPGGEVSSGMALYDVMQAIECPIRTVCVGIAASMAAVLFAAGDTRDILPHARVMIHDPLLSGGVGGSALHIRAISDDLMRTREMICATLAKHTGRTVDEIYEKTGKDSYFYADEAVEFGLADKIITRI